MNNAPEHPLSLHDSYSDIKAVSVPRNPRSEIQPMDSSFIATLKGYYTGRVNSQAIRAIDREGRPILEDILERV